MSGGNPSQPSSAYMKVVDTREEGEGLYEDLDEADGYLSPNQINSNFDVRANCAYIMADKLQSELEKYQ